MTRRALPAVAALLAIVACLVLSLPARAMAQRFEGYVGGVVTGKGSHFYVGDGLNLVFVDHRESHTPYRVCWHRLHHSDHRCWTGETEQLGQKDRIFTAAPSNAGKYLVKWTVRHHRKASWSFVNGAGD
jgi:hypothetical protein